MRKTTITATDEAGQASTDQSTEDVTGAIEGADGDNDDADGSSNDDGTDGAEEGTDEEDPDADDPDAGEPWDEERFKRTLTKKNNEARNLREAKKKLEAQLEELKPLIEAHKAAEDAKKSDLERAQERIQELEAAAIQMAKANTLALLKTEGYSDAQIKLVVGETAEEVEASAALLREAIPAPKADKKKPLNPDSLHGGVEPTKDQKSVGTPQSLAAGVRLY